MALLKIPWGNRHIILSCRNSQMTGYFILYMTPTIIIIYKIICYIWMSAYAELYTMSSVKYYRIENKKWFGYYGKWYQTQTKVKVNIFVHVTQLITASCIHLITSSRCTKCDISVSSCVIFPRNIFVL